MGCETLVEVVVDVGQVCPQSDEALTQLALAVVGEVAEETAQHLPLLFSEEGVVVHLVQVCDVGQHVVGIGHLLVDVVEVSQQQLAPSEEVVEGLVDASLCGERLVQLAHQLHGVGHLQRGVAAEEVADGDIGRAPDGLASLACQVVVEKEGGTLVGEDHGEA